MNIKLALRVMVIKGMSMVTNRVHISSTAGDTDMLPIYSYDSLLMPIMWHFIL